VQTADVLSALRRPEEVIFSPVGLVKTLVSGLGAEGMLKALWDDLDKLFLHSRRLASQCPVLPSSGHTLALQPVAEELIT
jgi:hypothetical protein